MEEILRAICPNTATTAAVLGQGAMKTDHMSDSSSQKEGGKAGALRTAEENVECLRAIKNALVGNDGAKQVALRLGVLGKLLSFLDAASTAGDGDSFPREATTTQAMGIFAILTSTKKRGDSFTPSAVRRIVEHIARALASPNERLQAAALRALTEMCVSGVIITPPAKLGHGELGATTMLSEALRRVAELLLEKVAVVGNHETTTWTPNIKSLGVEALAAVTRDRELASDLGPSVVSTGTALIRPILPSTNRRPRVATAAVGRVEARHAREALPVLQLLVNLSSAGPGAIATWLTNCTPGWSPWGALKGLELELNNTVKKVRILAGLVLINCVQGRARLGGDFPPSTPLHPNQYFTKPPFEDPSGGGGGDGGEGSGERRALDEVISHRVMPLLFRTMAGWASAPFPVSSRDSTCCFSALSDDCFRVACLSSDGVNAEAVARAITVGLGLGSLERQREAVRHGAVEALAAFLWRARAVVTSAQQQQQQQQQQRTDTGNASHHPDGVVLSRSSTMGDAGGDAIVIARATGEALGAMAILCERCVSARERLVALGFHSALSFWLTGDAAAGDDDSMKEAAVPPPPATSAPPPETAAPATAAAEVTSAKVAEGSGDDGAALLATLKLVQTLARSSVPRSALVSVGVYDSLIDVLMGRPDGSGGCGEEGGVSGEVWSLAARGLANMALEHEMAKEAIAESECLRRVCNHAIRACTEDKVRDGSMAILKSMCFLAPIHVRVKVVDCLGGVNGMLRLVQLPRNCQVYQGLQILRNLLYAVPFRDLCRSEMPPSGEGGPERVSSVPGVITREAATNTSGGASSSAPQNRSQGGSQNDRSQTWEGATERAWGRDVASVRRRFWGDPEPSGSGSNADGGGRGRDSSRRSEGQLEAMEVEVQLGLGTTTTSRVRCTRGDVARGEGREGRLPATVGPGAREDRDSGIARLIDAILGKLEEAEKEEGFYEASCAALHVLHALSVTSESQCVALRTPRVLRVVMPYCIPLARSRHERKRDTAALSPLAPSARTAAAEASTAEEEPGTAGGLTPPRLGSDRSSSSSRSSSGSNSGSDSGVPPHESADIAARLLLTQLIPERTGGEMTAAVRAFTAAMAAVPAAAAAVATVGVRGPGGDREGVWRSWGHGAVSWRLRMLG